MFHKLKQIRKIPKASARKLTKINIVFVLPFCVNHYDFLVNSRRLQGHKAKQGLEVPLPPNQRPLPSPTAVMCTSGGRDEGEMNRSLPIFHNPRFLYVTFSTFFKMIWSKICGLVQSRLVAPIEARLKSLFFKIITFLILLNLYVHDKSTFFN